MRRLLAIIIALALPSLAHAQVVNWGDYQDANQTIYVYFNTVGTDGVAESLASGAAEIYEDGSGTQITTAETLDNDFDSITGFHQLAIDLNDSGFEAGKTYTVILTAGTVDSVSAVGRMVGVFSVGRYASAADVNTALVAGTVGTNVAAIKTKTDFLPSATAGAAGGVFIAGTNAATTITTSLTTTFTGNLTGSIGSVGTNGITASSIDDDAIGADQIASSAIGAAEISTGAADEIADEVWDEVLSSGHAVADSASVRLSDILVDTGTSGVLVSDGTGTGQISLSGGAVDTVVTTTTTGSVVAVGTGAITAASIATGAIDADSTASDFLAEINAEADTALTDYGALKPTTAGRTLDINSTMEAQVDLTYIMGSALTQNSAGLFATRASDFFASADVASPGAFLDLFAASFVKLETTWELDGAVYRFTTNALEQAAGGGATAQEVWEYATRELTGGEIEFSDDTVEALAAEVWAVDGDTIDVADTAGELLNESSVGGSTPVSADIVGASRTWIGKQYRATNIVEVGDNFAGTLSLAPDLNPNTTIISVSSVSITGATSVTATDLSVTRDRKKANFTVPTLSTTGTYTVVVTVTTSDSQTIPTTCTLKVQ